MSADNVTPLRPGSEPPGAARDLTTAEVALSQAIGIIDLLQGAAARGAIEPPSNEESLARALAVVLELLEKTHGAIWAPSEAEEEGDD